MSKKLGPSDAIEQAMADALAAVERVEQESKAPKNGDTPAAQPESESGKVDVIPVEVEAKTKPAEVDAVPRDQFLRLAADFENYRKRAGREMDDARKYGIERLLKDLLPMLDNLDRALSHAEDDKGPVIEGIRMVSKQAHEILASHGVRAFASVGAPFDPERHEAVAQIPSDKHAPGAVIEEMLKGYTIHERLLRPAQVVVAAAPAVTTNASASQSGAPETSAEGGTGSAT